ncbi:MAG TPA: HD domain-containing phosphohydrolase [Rhodocyclaceae bacterium]|nr:HD domain-containing phosphohydrolase [Rhodocyclaceae bacterium]
MDEAAVRLADVVAALSVATDFGMGQPPGFAQSSCVLALRLGEALGLSSSALREVYYQALLRYIGCNVETDLLAAVAGDEIGFRREFAAIDNGSAPDIFQLFIRFILQTHRGQPPADIMRGLASGLLRLPQIRASFAGHCEVAQRLATRLGFDPDVIYALGQLYERWDGQGAPRGLKGEAIAPAVRVVALAQDALVIYRLAGAESAAAMVRGRRGTAYAPTVADVFCHHAERLLAGLEQEPSWSTVLALEPGDRPWLGPEALDTACAALADFVDLKSPFTLGHSSSVAALASAAAGLAGLPSGDVRALRRAALLHDLGRTGVSSAIWEKTGPLSEREWEQVRLHPYYTERILAGSSGLAPLGALGSLHHERLDGSGYHRGLPSDLLSPAARLLAVADAFQALVSVRPHRPAFSADQAAAELELQVRHGCHDRAAVDAVLAAAGAARYAHPANFTAGLSERELDVLRLLAHGLTTRQVAQRLVISPKTADHHIQHIYTKIGVSTRAAAALWAIQNEVVR